MAITTKTFKVDESLDDEQTIAEYLNQALEDQNPEMLLIVVNNIGCARCIAKRSRDTSWAWEPLQTLSEGTKPRYDAILKVVRALGTRLHVEPVQG